MTRTRMMLTTMMVAAMTVALVALPATKPATAQDLVWPQDVFQAAKQAKLRADAARKRRLQSSRRARTRRVKTGDVRRKTARSNRSNRGRIDTSKISTGSIATGGIASAATPPGTCQPAVSVVGDQAASTSGAKAQAEKAWQQQIRFRHGELFADPRNAMAIAYRCVDSSIRNLANRATEVIGINSQFKRCSMTATPCQAPQVAEGSK